MNNILQLKGQFQKRKAPSGFGPVNLPKGKSVSVEHVLKLKKQLQDIVLFWSKEKIIKGKRVVFEGVIQMPLLFCFFLHKIIGYFAKIFIFL